MLEKIQPTGRGVHTTGRIGSSGEGASNSRVRIQAAEPPPPPKARYDSATISPQAAALAARPQLDIQSNGDGEVIVDAQTTKFPRDLRISFAAAKYASAQDNAAKAPEVGPLSTVNQSSPVKGGDKNPLI
jgi:hypothetical protein